MSFVLLGLAVTLAANLLASSLLSALVGSCLFALEPRLVRLQPRARAAAALALALLPATGGLILSLGLVVPTWIVREPWQSGESGGLVLWATAAAGAVLVLFRLRAGLAVLLRTRRVSAEWTRRAATLEGLPLPALRFDHELPLAVLSGLRRPRLLLANRLVAALDGQALRAIAAHELGHAAAADNLKRLLLATSPDPLAMTAVGKQLRLLFDEASEAAADHAACAHVPSVVMARTLVEVAKLFPAGRRLELSLASFTGEQPLAERVRGLLAQDASPSRWDERDPIWAAAAVAAVAFLTVGAIAVLRSGPHAAIEMIVQLLS